MAWQTHVSVMNMSHSCMLHAGCAPPSDLPASLAKASNLNAGSIPETPTQRLPDHNRGPCHVHYPHQT